MSQNHDCKFMRDGKCMVLYETECTGCRIRMKLDHVKPCPFCGKAAIAYHIPDDMKNGGLWTVGCTEDSSCFGNYNHMAMLFTTKETAIAAWNMRPHQLPSIDRFKGECPSTIGERIRWLRYLFDMQRKELSQLIGVSCSVIKEWENGTKEPFATDVGRICEVFGTTCDYIIIGEGKYDAPYAFPLDTIGERIRMMRLENLLSQVDISRKVGHYVNTVGAWENAASNPKASDIALLSELFHVSCEWLIYGVNRSISYLKQKRIGKIG